MARNGGRDFFTFLPMYIVPRGFWDKKILTHWLFLFESFGHLGKVSSVFSIIRKHSTVAFWLSCYLFFFSLPFCIFAFLPFCLFVFSHLISLDAWPCIAGELHRVARHRGNWRSHQSWGKDNFHIFTILFQLRELVNQRKNNCVCVFNRGTTNLPICHIWLTHESHFPPKFHQQLPKPLKVKKSYSFCPNPK